MALSKLNMPFEQYVVDLCLACFAASFDRPCNLISDIEPQKRSAINCTARRLVR